MDAERALPPPRRRARACTHLLPAIAIISLAVVAACQRSEQALSAAQRAVLGTLRQRLDDGEITRAEYDVLRSQIEPRKRVDAAFQALDAERARLADDIAAGGYDGHEDCFEPPEFMLTSEVVPRTPVDPDERTRLRADLRTRDVAAQAAVASYLSSSGVDPSVAAVRVRSDIDQWGGFHARFRQTHDGVPLTKGGLLVHEAPTGSRSVDDFTLAGIDVDVTPSVESAAAEDAAARAVDPAGSRGYLASSSLVIEPDLEQVLVDPGDPGNGASYAWRVRDARLAWRVVVAPDYTDLNTAFDSILADTSIAHDDPGDAADRDANTLLGGREDAAHDDLTPWTYPTATPWLVTVDAHTGDVVSMESLLEEDLDDIAVPPSVGPGLGYFSGLVELNTTYWAPFDAWVLADFTRSKPGTANIVMHGKNLDSHDVADFALFLDANNAWGNGRVDFDDPACLSCTRGQTPAVDIAFGVQRTYDFLEHVLGRFGTDGAGLSQIAIAHWDMAYTDAHFNASSGLIAFGNGEDASGPGNYSLGTVAHEIGHAIWQQEDVGKSGNPAKAMNEGHGDVLGGLVDIYQDNADGQGDWLYRIPWAGGSWRGRTLDPAGYDECVTSNDIEVCKTGLRYWDLLAETETFEHAAGIPFTRAFMHLAEGSSPDASSPYYTKFFPDEPMRGIGLDKAASIWIHMVSHFLPDSPNLAEARLAAWQAAEDLFGPGSTEAKATANAFAAVGMGARAAGPAAPTIEFAKVHSVSPRTLTARTYAVLDDDTGAVFVAPPGMARKNDVFLGYLDMSEAQVGQSPVEFRAVDSEGNEATTTRICRLAYRPQLLDDGGFEATTSSNWTGAAKGDDEGGAFLGARYLKAGPTPTRQAVDLGTVKGPELSYWVAANKGVALFDYLRVRVLDPGLNELAVLATHGYGDDWLPRPARSNGYLNFRHDLGAWEGQPVVIEFAASASGLFRIDHAVVSYASVQLLPPDIEVFETDNSAILTVSDADFAPFEAMDLHPRIHVDDVEVGPAVAASNPSRSVVALALDQLGAGPHFAHTVAVNDDDAFIAAGAAEWFAPKPVNELLTNGRFESQLDGWAFDGLGVSLENANTGEVFQGDFALRLGGAGAVNEARVWRNVSVPSGIKSLKFTLRVRREYADANDDVEDQLVVDFLDQSDVVLDSAVLYDTGSVRLDHEPPNIFQTHVLVSYAPSAATLAGKTVKVRLRVVEDDEGASAFIVDNASLSYAEWGLQIGG